MKSLGKREIEIYGEMTFMELSDMLYKVAFEKGVMIKAFQSNHEGVLIDLLEEHADSSDALIIISSKL